MAIYRCEAKAISRGQGRSCVAAAAYRHAQTLRDTRQKLTHSYERKQGVIHSEIIAPGFAPQWVHHRESLWNQIDAAEKRKDAMTAREILVALPRELSREQQVEAVRAFVQEEFTARGIIADVAIHAPAALDGEKQPHAHIMVSDRPLDPSQPNGLAVKKDRTLAQADGIEALRERWGRHCNAGLERAHVAERVDHRSLADQRQAMLVVAADDTRPRSEREEAAQRAEWLDRRPEPKIGPVATEMARRGRGPQAHAFREAMAVRRNRSLLVRLVNGWHQLRAQAVELGQVVEAQARAVAEGLKSSAKRLLPDRAALLAAANSVEAEQANELLMRRKAEKLLRDHQERWQAEQKARQEAERQRQEQTTSRGPSQGWGRDGPSW